MVERQKKINIISNGRLYQQTITVMIVTIYASISNNVTQTQCFFEIVLATVFKNDIKYIHEEHQIIKPQTMLNSMKCPSSTHHLYYEDTLRHGLYRTRNSP